MKQVFADTLYWVALARPRDPWKPAAKRARTKLGRAVQIVTTDEVLAEFLTGMSGLRELREEAAQTVHAILEDASCLVLPQSHESLLQGMNRYEERPDKQYSLVDCVSMNAMDALGIKEILTNDHHFTQEGFTVLIGNKDT